MGRYANDISEVILVGDNYDAAYAATVVPRLQRQSATMKYAQISLDPKPKTPNPKPRTLNPKP